MPHQDLKDSEPELNGSALRYLARTERTPKLDASSMDDTGSQSRWSNMRSVAMIGAGAAVLYVISMLLLALNEYLIELDSVASILAATLVRTSAQILLLFMFVAPVFLLLRLSRSKPWYVGAGNFALSVCSTLLSLAVVLILVSGLVKFAPAMTEAQQQAYTVQAAQIRAHAKQENWSSTKCEKVVREMAKDVRERIK